MKERAPGGKDRNSTKRAIIKQKCEICTKSQK